MSDIKIGDWVYDKNNPNFYFEVCNISEQYYHSNENLALGGLHLFKKAAIQLERLTTSNIKKLKDDKLICITNNLKKTCGVVSGQIVYFRSYNLNRIFFVKNEQDRSIEAYVANINNFAIHPDVVIEEDIDRDGKYLVPYIELKVVQSSMWENKRSIRCTEGKSFRDKVTEWFEEGELLYLISKKDFEKLMEQRCCICGKEIIDRDKEVISCLSDLDDEDKFVYHRSFGFACLKHHGVKEKWIELSRECFFNKGE